MNAKQHPLELLAPARNADIAIEAIRHGADAVYMGSPSHGARAGACNPVSDISRVADYAHRFGARVYVTLNTLIYDNELKQVERLIHSLYRAGVDALIVQDMAVLTMDIPPIALHASTQCDIRTPEKAAFLERAGMSQLVLPRELNLDEIRQMRQVTTVPLEAFVHGALCVSYSGDCQASFMTTGRSANRGCCAQLCRLPYNLEDAGGRRLVTNKHLLSLRDMNRMDHLSDMIEAGISSFKIEGRLKDADYVKNTVAAYHQALNAIIDHSEGRLRRSSRGNVDLRFTPDTAKSFNRGFTPYFLIGDTSGIGSIDTPKWTGTDIGRVTGTTGNRIRIKTSAQLHNGDGLGYFDDNGSFTGFRANKVESGTVFTTRDIRLKPGTVIYRNHDKQWDDMMAGDTATRSIAVDMRLRGNSQWIAIDVTDENGMEVTMRIDGPFDTARAPQDESRRKNLSKLGNSYYRLRNYTDTVPQLFVPASRISQLRRDVMELMDRAIITSHRFDYRRPADASAMYPATGITYHDNVANRQAEAFYRAHGVTSIDSALETTSGTISDEITVMTTRYCLRRQLGQCLKAERASEWKGPVFLTAPGIRFRLDFDCRNCRMKVVKPSSDPHSC